MNKGFWKGLGFSFLVGSSLNLVLVFIFSFFQVTGTVEWLQKNPFVIVGIYLIVIVIYTIVGVVRSRRESAQNLEKLRREVEIIAEEK